MIRGVWHAQTLTVYLLTTESVRYTGKKKNIYFCHILNRPISPHKLYLELLKNLYPESLKELWIIYLNILERTMMKYGQTEAPTEMAGLHIQY